MEGYLVMKFKVFKFVLSLKFFMLNRKHYFISSGLFLICSAFIFILTSPTNSESHKKSLNTVTSSLENKVIKTNSNKKNGNLLYTLFKMDVSDSDDLNIRQDVVEYDGYFKKIEFQAHVIHKNDTLSNIAKKYNTNIDTLISYNDIKSIKSLQIGKTLLIPNIKGILHTVSKGETLEIIAKKYKQYNVRFDDIKFINEIKKNKITFGERLFIPGALLPKSSPLRRLEHMFAIPVIGQLVSGVGGRIHPFGLGYGFHPGLDISARYGSPVRAARNGRVIFSGWRGGYGKLVIIDHGSGLQSRYGHLSVILVRAGMYITKRQLIGRVGSTGLSTGPHLHFEVRKYNRPLPIIRNLSGLNGRIGSFWSRWN